MIRLKSPDNGDNYYLVTANVILPGDNRLAILIPSGAMHYESLDVSYMKTSGSMDRFRNKACAHFALDGEISLSNSSDYTSYYYAGRVGGAAPFPGGYTLRRHALSREGKTYYADVVGIGMNGTWDCALFSKMGSPFLFSISWQVIGDDINVTHSLTSTSLDPLWKQYGYTWLQAWARDSYWWGSYAASYRRWQSFRIRNYKTDPYTCIIGGGHERNYNTNSRWNKDDVFGEGANPRPITDEDGYYKSSLTGGWTLTERSNTYSSNLVSPYRGYELFKFTSDAVTSTEYNPETMNLVFQELMGEAIESIRNIDTNFVTLIPELLNLKADLSSALDACKQLVTSPNVKSLADAFLSGKYGYRLTLSDMKALGETFASGQPFGLPAYVCAKSANTAVPTLPHYYSGVKVSRHYSCTLSSLPNSFSSAYLALRRNSAWITLENMWDTIPFSFVVDWFVSVSDFLSSIDLYAEMRNYQLHTVVKSTKCTGDITFAVALPELAAYALQPYTLVSFKRYHRWIESSFDQVPFLPKTGGIMEIFSTHWPEATALIVQSVKKK